MHRFEVSREIEAELEQVWRILDDFNSTWVFHPAVRHSDSVNGKPTGLGAQRECTLYAGPKIQERIVAYDAEHHSYEITVVDFGGMPLKQMNVAIKADAAGTRRTRLTYSGFLVPKFGLLGWIMAKAVMVGRFEKMMSSLIDGVETHLRTGQIVGEDGEPEPRSAAAA